MLQASPFSDSAAQVCDAYDTVLSPLFFVPSHVAVAKDWPPLSFVSVSFHHKLLFTQYLKTALTFLAVCNTPRTVTAWPTESQILIILLQWEPFWGVGAYVHSV